MLTVKQRLAISVGITVCIALVLALWPMPEYKEYAPPAPVLVIAATWFGPMMLLALPLLGVWISFGAETREGFGVGIGISTVVLVLCLIAFWYAKAVYRGYYGPIGAQ